MPRSWEAAKIRFFIRNPPELKKPQHLNNLNTVRTSRSDKFRHPSCWAHGPARGICFQLPWQSQRRAKLAVNFRRKFAERTDSIGYSQIVDPFAHVVQQLQTLPAARDEIRVQTKRPQRPTRRPPGKPPASLHDRGGSY